MDRTLSGRDAFVDWVNRVHAHLKREHGWSIERIAKEAKVSRSLLANWRKGDFSQGDPQRKTVYKMCANLDIPMDEPFAIFGWDPAGPAPVEPTPLPRATMAERYRELLAIRYDTPDITSEEEAEIDAQIDLVVAMIKQRRKRRAEGPGQAGTAA